jgi:PAS domain S-box-containing protein
MIRKNSLKLIFFCTVSFIFLLSLYTYIRLNTPIRPGIWINQLIFGLSLGFILLLFAMYYQLNNNLSNARKLETQLVGQKNDLEKSEYKFNRMFNLCPVSLSLAESPSGKIIMVNDQFLKTFKFSKDEVIGYTAEELGIITDPERERILEEVSRNDLSKNREIEMSDKSGAPVPVIVSAEKIEIGSQRYILGSYIEIHERKIAELSITRANEELKKMNEELSSFTYICSHDLQEPLRKIQTFISLFKDRDYNSVSEEGKHCIDRIHNSANRMQLLINDLLAYTRTETTDRNFEMVEFRDLLEEVQNDLKEEIHNKHATIRLEGQGQMRIMPFQFRQLMINILGNSLKFSADERALYIEIRYELAEHPDPDLEEMIPDARYHRITIADNGIGFQQSYSKKIFAIFQRLHSRLEYEGTGIGLAIVKKIIQNHRGYIFAYGQLGKGSVFEIYLPA